VTRTLGIILTIVGLLSALAGSLWHLFFPTPDANIGAGALVVLGLPVAALGVLLMLVSLVIGRSKTPG